MLSDKHIVLGVSGSIAAYKAVYLLRLLTEQRAEVWPVLTPSACRFVGPLTFSALSGHRAVVDLWTSGAAGEIGHVELAHRADAVVLAPTTADLLARLAQGRADDPLTAIALATRAPLVIAPAMEDGMWSHEATQEHVVTLVRRGARIVAPVSGELASGRVGAGRLAEPEHILEVLLSALGPNDLLGHTVLVTAGPTREAFDPARFVSNASTGKMGYALARVARRRGARVILVSGPSELTPPGGCELVRITTARELLEACERHLGDASILVMAAAPVDYRPSVFSKSKIKKDEAGGRRAVEFESTPDILRTLRARERGVFTVGFAAESGQIVSHAKEKLARKDLDLIVANDITRPDAGFAVETNAVVIIDREGRAETLPTMSKEHVATALLDRVVQHLEPKGR
jgi:phosphopantothenoylcysteine decarboxylase / phosphopantothenate---cysteine ligase